jgi:hypothetical protein
LPHCFALLVGIVLAEMTHKFSQRRISVSIALFVVAFALLMRVRQLRLARKSLYPPI